MTKKVVIIGGGIAGMEAASTLSRMNIDVLLIEKKQQLGGHVGEWDHLFPNFRNASNSRVHHILFTLLCHFSLPKANALTEAYCYSTLDQDDVGLT